MHLSYLFALGSNLTFSFSTIIYTSFSKSVSVLWMNSFKTSVALVCAFAWLTVSGGWAPVPTQSIAAFMLSGLIALNVGDLFLLAAFTRLGPGRTMMLWGFEPLFLGWAGSLLFGQPFLLERLFALVFFFGCLFIISHEKFKQAGHWEVRGLLYALIGMSLDATGIVLSRYGYDHMSGDVMNGHFYRCLGSVLGFVAISFFRPINLKANLMKLTFKQRGFATFGAFLGTFVALWFYLSAIRIGHLQTIAAISITSPVFSTIFESIYLNQKPTPKLLLAFVFFLIGFMILLATG
ncbi:MAG TPA: DMT family transporter [Bdellovibrionales bacterium]|nr:DMT family transporter [Bdellovibrionales bacterium]